MAINRPAPRYTCNCSFQDSDNKFKTHGTISPMRMVTAVHMEKPELTVPLSREFFMRMWSRVS